MSGITFGEIEALQAKMDGLLEGAKISTVLEVLGASLARTLALYAQNGADPVEELLNLKHRIYITLRRERAQQLERELIMQQARPQLIVPS